MTRTDAPTLDELRPLAWHWGSLRPDDLWWVSTEDGYDCLSGDARAAALQPLYHHTKLTALPISPPRRGMFINELTDDPSHVRITWPTRWRQIPTWTVTLPVEPLRDAILDAERYTGHYWATLLVRDTSRAKRWQIARMEPADSTEHDDLDYCLHRWLMHVRTETMLGRAERVRPFRGFWPKLAPLTRARRIAKEKTT